MTPPRALPIVLALVVLALAGCGGSDDEGVTRGPSNLPVVALTFDDGLNGETTRKVAALLEAAGMQGSFFVVGRTLDGQQELADALLARGHVLGNHSFDHARAQANDRAYDQLPRAEGEFVRVAGVCPRFFRPPFGTETAGTRAAVRRAGMQTILWDVEVGDWSETDPERLAARVLEQVRAGSIVLLHDGSDGQPGADRSVLLRALPMIVDGLRARGLTSVGLDRLLDQPAYLEGC